MYIQIAAGAELHHVAVSNGCWHVIDRMHRLLKVNASRSVNNIPLKQMLWCVVQDQGTSTGGSTAICI